MRKDRKRCIVFSLRSLLAIVEHPNFDKIRSEIPPLFGGAFEQDLRPLKQVYLLVPEYKANKMKNYHEWLALFVDCCYINYSLY
jgi:hypothetical protein